MVDLKKFIGLKFNMLTILDILQGSPVNNYIKMAKVRCDCGVVKMICFRDVKAGHTKSCGCYQKSKLSKHRTKHGLTKHPLFRVWEGMIERCYKTKNSDNRTYLFFGVTVCDEWRNDFKSFYDWAIKNGYKKGLQIDKDIKYIKKNGTQLGMIYSPEYCSFVTSKVNSRYKCNSLNINIDGVNKPLIEWAEEKGISYHALLYRFKNNWSTDKLFKPSVERKKNIK